ncbi:MAG: DUF3298 domain-containing protein [Calditrichaeota bacterium]|nr:MAG: DUF3298 domain-containing protein [Calditrichota bacterium]
MFSIKYLILILLATNIFIACKPQLKSKNETHQTSDTLTYEIQNFSNEFGNCDSTTYLTDCARIELSFPKFINSNINSVADSLNSRILNYLLVPIYEKTPTSIQEKMDFFLNDYKGFLEESPNYKIEWYSEIFCNVIRNDSLLVVLDFSEVGYTGGAHPNSFQKFISINSQNGKIVRKADFIKDEKSLEKVAEKIFRTQKEIPDEESLKDNNYFWNEGKFYLNDNFAILDSGLVFFYNNYEIASYASGQTKLFLPNSAISEFIKKD